MKKKPVESQTETNYFAHMNEAEKQAEIDYARLVKEDEGKTYMDILPKEFKTFKRSIIKNQILAQIDRVTKFINESPLFDGKVFTELEVTRYMMRGENNTNFYLAHKYIPSKSTFELLLNPEYKNLSKEERQEKMKPYEDLSHELQWLKQNWEAWESRQRIKAGKMNHDYDVEKNGIPRTSRANLCSIFIPVKGKWIVKQTGTIKLYNPRNKKTVKLTIEQYVKDDNIFVCLNDKGEKVYLATYETVNDSWDALFSINKEIFSGWWNKILIWK